MIAAPPTSLFDRTLSRRRPVWGTLGLVALVYFPTLAAAYALGMTDFTNPSDRSLLTAPTILAYTSGDAIGSGPVCPPRRSPGA
jgi:hypothetical protein